eukprot:355607-Chlamydomonas_euryale.AAC.10
MKGGGKGRERVRITSVLVYQPGLATSRCACCAPWTAIHNCSTLTSLTLCRALLRRSCTLDCDPHSLHTYQPDPVSRAATQVMHPGLRSTLDCGDASARRAGIPPGVHNGTGGTAEKLPRSSGGQKIGVGLLTCRAPCVCAFHADVLCLLCVTYTA